MSRVLRRSFASRCRHLLDSRGGEGGGLQGNSPVGFSAAGSTECRFRALNPKGWAARAMVVRGQSSSAANADDPDFDPTEARSPPSEKIHRLVDEIASLTLLEVSDLTTLLKKKIGLTNMPMMPMMGGMMPGAGQGGGGAAPAAEEKKPEKTAFDVRLEKFDASAKIKIIKEVRTFTSLGLKEAKELVEKIPALLKKGVSKEEATQIIDKIKAVGGTAVME